METYHNHFSPEALMQLAVILRNDYTLEDKYFRLKIDNKGCSGFEYHLGFSEILPEDTKVHYSQDNFSFEYIMDPFTAYYCKNGIVTFERDDETGDEGFLYKNLDEKTFYGKFYKDETLVPKETNGS